MSVCMCVDTNECLQDNVCGRGQCVNVDGGFECECEQGYVAGVDGTCEGTHACLPACQSLCVSLSVSLSVCHSTAVQYSFVSLVSLLVNIQLSLEASRPPTKFLCMYHQH